GSVEGGSGGGGRGRREGGRLGGRQIDQIAIRGCCTGRVGSIKRIGNEDGGSAGAVCHVSPGRDRGEKKSLSRTIEHQNFAIRVWNAVELVPARCPLDRRTTELRRALVPGVAPKFTDMRSQYRRHKCRHAVFGFAH